MTEHQDVCSTEAENALESVNPDDFRRGMRYLAAGCSIVACDNGTYRAGFTATAVSSLTTDPPRLLVCVNRNVFAHSLISEQQALSVNVLKREQESLARRFAGMLEGVTPEQRFQDGKWRIAGSGAPVLEGALLSFDCRVVEILVASTHDVFVCEVVGVETSAGEEGPLIYFDGRFGGIA